MLTAQEAQRCPLLKAVWQEPGISLQQLLTRGLVPDRARRDKLATYLANGKLIARDGCYWPYTPEYAPVRPQAEVKTWVDPSWVDPNLQASKPAKAPNRETIVFGSFGKPKKPKSEWESKYNPAPVSWFKGRIQTAAEIRCIAAIQQLMTLGKPFDYTTIEAVALVPAGFVEETRRIRIMADQAISQMARQEVQA